MPQCAPPWLRHCPCGCLELGMRMHCLSKQWHQSCKIYKPTKYIKENDTIYHKSTSIFNPQNLHEKQSIGLRGRNLKIHHHYKPKVLLQVGVNITMLVSGSKVKYKLKEMQRQLRNVQISLWNVLTRVHRRKKYTSMAGRQKLLLKPNHYKRDRNIIGR